AGNRRAAANLDEQARLMQRVLLVVAVMVERLHLCAPELLGPVTVLARLLRGAQIVDGAGDRARILLEGDRIELIRARQLRAHEPTRAGADTTFDASDARVRAGLVSDELRLHHRVAGLPAEVDRLAVLVSAVAAEGAHEDEE